MKSILLGPLVVIVFSGMIASGTKLYIPFTYGLTWQDAQNFCKMNFIDLATFDTWSDVERTDLTHYLVWIGLKKDCIWYRRWFREWKECDWKSSDEQSYYRFWAEHEPRDGSCAVVRFSNKKMYAEDCEKHRMFFCRDGDTDIFVNETKSWSDASSYCEEHYNHLVTFRGHQMNDIFTEKDFPIWVGQRREEGSFIWSSGNSGYENWTVGEPSDNRDCVTISSLTKLMATEYCEVRRPFICMYDANSNVILVKENKSWEEALEHCRGLSKSGLRYDLVSVQSGEENQHTMSKAMEAETEEVWTGLRYLGDEWLWVNGESMMYSDLPQCPMLGQRCGALSKNSQNVETRDCLERKNFLCYRFMF